MVAERLDLTPEREVLPYRSLPVAMVFMEAVSVMMAEFQRMNAEHMNAILTKPPKDLRDAIMIVMRVLKERLELTTKELDSMDCQTKGYGKDQNDTNFKAPPGLQGWTPRGGKPKDSDQMQLNPKQPNAKEHFGELGNLELSSVYHEKNARELTITIDSGASENVIARGMVPGVPIVESAGSKAGVMYVTANGDTMPNKGQQHIYAITPEGEKCRLNMQVTDVNKPLMSVARICDAGHVVTFRAEGGTIRNLKTGQKTAFDRVDNVYRLKVGLQPGFARQGIQ